jgi:hypothetical protein
VKQGLAVETEQAPSEQKLDGCNIPPRLKTGKYHDVPFRQAVILPATLSTLSEWAGESLRNDLRLPSKPLPRCLPVPAHTDMLAFGGQITIHWLFPPG